MERHEQGPPGGRHPGICWHFASFLSSWEVDWGKGEQLDAPLTLSSQLPAKGQSLAFSQPPVFLGVLTSKLQNKALC